MMGWLWRFLHRDTDAESSDNDRTHIDEHIAIAHSIDDLQRRQARLERILLVKTQQGVLTQQWEPYEWEQP